MRVLAIDTSSRRGTVALVDGGTPVVVLESTEPHSDRLLPLVEEALALSGFSRHSVDRIGVGIGPGSFTGVRVGVALGQGIALGLGRPIVGVSSLRAMCRGVPLGVPGLRCALLDARRDELFVGIHRQDGEELVAARTIARAGLHAFLEALAERPAVLVGEVLATLECPLAVLRSEETDLPHAVPVALVAAESTPEASPPEPLYVRPADAIRPDLPKSPLSSGQPT